MTTKMSYLKSNKDAPAVGLIFVGAIMTRVDRLLTLSTVACCMCDHGLSVQELQEFYSITDEQLHGEIYCRACVDAHLVLCRECSGRYTADGLCEECVAREYAMAG